MWVLQKNFRGGGWNARSYLFQVALEQAHRCWVPRSSKAACSLLPRSLRLGELMNFNLRRVLMVKWVVCAWQLEKQTHTQRSWSGSTNLNAFPFAVQKWNLKKKDGNKEHGEERTRLYSTHLRQQENKPLIRSTLTSQIGVNDFSSCFAEAELLAAFFLKQKQVL